METGDKDRARFATYSVDVVSFAQEENREECNHV